MSVSSTLLTRLEGSLRTPSGKIALIALASTVLTTATILSTQAVRRRTKRSHLRDEIEDLVHHDEELGEEDMIDFTRSAGASARGGPEKGKGMATATKPRKKTSEVIIREALARNYVFFGDDGMAKIRDSFVVVVGLGGVGSAAAVMLVRSGVRKIRLVDFDQVSLSSLNVRRLDCAPMGDGADQVGLRSGTRPRRWHRSEPQRSRAVRTRSRRLRPGSRWTRGSSCSARTRRTSSLKVRGPFVATVSV